MIKLDKGIKIPQAQGKGRKLKYPFDSMQVGDSFEVPAETSGQGVVSAGKSWALRNKKNYQFMGRTINGRFRVWRTK